MQTQIRISPLSNDYCGQVAELVLPIQQTEFNVPITLADQPDLMDLEAAYFRPGGHFWGAFVGGELAGTIGLLAPPKTGAPFGVLRKMFVKQPFRGAPWGIAQKLLETLIAYGRERGMEDLYLGTTSRMKVAHRFYERNGFKRVEKEELPAVFPLMPVDDVFYHLDMRPSKNKGI
jgi:GNAT superfamily N-acetyltransferase